MIVSIVIPSYGKNVWEEVAETRALPTALAQEAHEVLIGHDPEGTIASVRNELAEKATGDWLLFLDADDELAPGFLGAMQRAWEQGSRGGDPSPDGPPPLLTPARSYSQRQGRWGPEHFETEKDIQEGNWLPIGTLVSRSLFMEVGGFREWGLYEDWDLWARCVNAGTEIVKVPEAVYLAHVSLISRNRNAKRKERNYWHQAIGHDLWPHYYDAPTEVEHEAQVVAGVRKLQVA